MWIKQIQLPDEEKRLFLQTGVVASVALCVLNDSGVVAAAISMFAVVSTHYYWLSQNQDLERKKTKPYACSGFVFPCQS
ncbi:hypothetical protein [Bacillus sp. JCM 19034]|uniref:hypothetical protein n=1 Tax=Bacillus sp. JCM 19034 TaxID=1481928 RepID=UPI0018D0CBA5|nr:hypothetical protein [Bacillus sp. JCM 19034]